MSFLKEIKEMLATWQTTAMLIFLLSLAMGSATFLETGLGTEAALSVIYHSWWFTWLFILLIANFVLLSHKHLLRKRKQWGVLLLHYGFAVILIGAWATHIWGYEGIMRSCPEVLRPWSHCFGHNWRGIRIRQWKLPFPSSTSWMQRRFAKPD